MERTANDLFSRNADNLFSINKNIINLCVTFTPGFDDVYFQYKKKCLWLLWGSLKFVYLFMKG